MRFSLVLAAGRMRANDRLAEADGRLYHLDLPRAAELTDPVRGTVDGEAVSISALDVLGAIRHLYGGSQWTISGAGAQLTGATAFPHSLAQGRKVLEVVSSLIERGELLEDIEPPQHLAEGRRRLRWLAVSSDADGNQVEKRFEERIQAEAWLQRREFARRIAWPFVRTDELFEDAARILSLDELLDVADYFAEPPSSTLGRAEATA